MATKLEGGGKALVATKKIPKFFCGFPNLLGESEVSLYSQTALDKSKKYKHFVFILLKFLLV